jgi:pimeloyl-ACP methyl ester carboxylesterase
VGRSASDELVERVRVVIATVPAPTLAARLRNVLSVDVRPSLAKCKVPILYLRGTEDRIIRDVSMKALVEAVTIRVKVNQIAAPHLLLQVAPKQAWSAIQERELITQ